MYCSLMQKSSQIECVTFQKQRDLSQNYVNCAADLESDDLGKCFPYIFIFIYIYVCIYNMYVRVYAWANQLPSLRGSMSPGDLRLFQDKML